MSKIWFYIFPPLTLVIFFFSNEAQNLPLFYSFLSVVLILCCDKIANNKVSKEYLQPKIIALLFLLGYDFLLSFTFGTNALSFCLASIASATIFGRYKTAKILSKIVFLFVFYTIQGITNYLTNDIFNIEIIGLQLLMFATIIVIEKFFFLPINRQTIYFD